MKVSHVDNVFGHYPKLKHKVEKEKLFPKQKKYM